MKKKEIYGALLLSGFMLWPLWAHSTTYPETEQTSVVQQETGKITLNLKNASMKELLDEIHSQTGLDFMYSNEQFADMKEITLKVKNESVEKVLKQVFGNNGYDYQIKGKIVTLRKRKLNANQAYEVQGTVYDAEGIPVIGATVMVKGTHTGVVTDVNGHYQINVKPNQTLSYSYLGMEPKDLKYTGSKFLDVILTYDKKTVLDNVVVTGIFRKSKESYTGAVSTVTKEQLEINTGQNLLQTLKNMDASINFSIDNLNGSNPNNIPNINIRGNSSLPMSVEEYNESNQNNPNTPLVILDGFEISITKLMDYNDEEIESINILKDAAATAIYGSRGANGVIVVVTKRPEAGKLKVSAEVGLIMEIPDLSSYNMLNAAEKLEVEKRVGLYDENYSISGNNEYKLKEAYNNRLKTVLSGTDTDWLSKPLHTGVGSKYNLRLEGGSDQFRWATSLQYKNTEGAMKGSSRKTFNGSITLMYQLQNLIFRNYTSVDINHGQESKYGSFSDYVTQQPYNAPYDADIKELAKEMKLDFEELKQVIADLHEFNPMMGHRGCRLAVTYPEIAEMQTQAVIEAALQVNKECGYNIVPEIMIPLVGEIKELKYVKDVVTATADRIIKEAGSNMTYHVGTMIEIPRAALLADKIAEEAEFFSFGTNDLTQMTFGFSRDDAGKFLKEYYAKKIFEQDPFARLDQNGVGKLVDMAANLGKQTRPNIKLGICGEHGGDPSSIDFCHRVGLSYVSCSPYRVPIARLAAAQSNIRNPR